jgi:hypothetical protein
MSGKEFHLLSELCVEVSYLVPLNTAILTFNKGIINSNGDMQKDEVENVSRKLNA